MFTTRTHRLGVLLIIAFVGCGCSENKKSSGTRQDSATVIECDSGPGCLNAASRNIESPQRDVNAAAAAIERSCTEFEHGPGCHTLAVMYRQGRGLKRDLAKTKQFLTRGCELDHGPSCFELAQQLGASPEAKNMLNKACAQGVKAACP